MGKQRWEESEKRREEKRRDEMRREEKRREEERTSKKRMPQKKEDPGARKVGSCETLCFSNDLWLWRVEKYAR